MTKSVINIFALLVVTASGCGGSSSDGPLTDSSQPVEVAVARVSLETRPERYEAPGTVVAATEAVLSSEVTGRVIAVHVREGARVREGQTLVEIDDRSAQSRLQEAEAAVTEAEVALQEAIHATRSAEAALEASEANARLASSTYQRYQELLQRNSVSRQEFDEVEARYQSAQAELRRAEQGLAAAKSREGQVEARISQVRAARENASVGLGYTRVAAPFEGTVIRRQVEPGDLASPGRPLLTVEGRDRYHLHVNLNESIATVLSLDQAVEVLLPSLDLTLSTEIEELIPAADPSTRTMLVKLRLPTKPEVHSGMFGRAFFAIGETTSLLIPEESIIRRGQLVGVLAVDAQERARFQLIKVGRTREGSVEVLSGLEQGDLVITEPGSVMDGQLVRVVTQRG